MKESNDIHDPVEAMSEEQLDRMLARLAKIRDTRTESLRSKVYALLRKRRNRRMRLRIARGCAAVMAIALVLSGGWYLMDRFLLDNDINITRFVEDAKLTMPDGTQIILDSTTFNSRVVASEDVAITHEQGRLKFEKMENTEQTPVELTYSNLDIPRGMTFDIILEDGTHVWLNAGSRLRFPTSFAAEERRVYLEGEAYFDVAHDPLKPFLVEAGEQVLTVLGTVFNVYAYPGEPMIRTALVDGSVSLATKDNTSTVVLSPGELAQFVSAASEFVIAQVDMKEVAAWREGRFAFNNKTFHEIFLTMSRWYDMQFVFDDPEAADLVLMGNLRVYDNIETILEIIESSGHVRIRVEGKLIRISLRK